MIIQSSKIKKIYGRPLVLRDREEIMRSVVDNLFRIRQIHLLTGPSGSGKTRFGLPMLEAIRNGENVLGHPSHPSPFIYVAADRDYDTARALLYELGLDPEKWPIFSLLEDKIFNDMPFTRALTQYILPQFPGTKLLFIEAIGMLVPGGKIADYNAVKSFLHDLMDICHEYDITMIGTAHTPKMKKDEGYELTRENVLGSVAWGGTVDTIVNFELRKRSDPTDPGRKIVVWPHSFGKAQVFHMAFEDDGMLHPSEDPALTKRNDDSQSRKLIKQFLSGKGNLTFISGELTQYFMNNKSSHASAERVLREMVHEGIVEKLKRGEYRARQLDALDVTPLD